MKIAFNLQYLFKKKHVYIFTYRNPSVTTVYTLWCCTGTGPIPNTPLQFKYRTTDII